MELSPTLDLVFRLTVAVVLGGMIGLNRELKHKPAGLRTHALVALGAAVVVCLVSWSAAQGPGDVPAHFDALSRVVQGLITGIGFLGAGVIMRTENKLTVHGLTTAASIWLAACLGAACGAGAWLITGCAFVLVMLILIAGGPLEKWVLRGAQRRAQAELDEDRGSPDIQP